jgi:two-component system, chemotaxis family, protein-glutamate methylesterase/glutaminase
VRILIVDDSAFMRTALVKMLKGVPGIEVVDTAKDGLEGLEKAKALKPDVMTLDIEMPVLDGLSTLKRLRREMSEPPAVIICSSLTKEGSHEALKALRYGAADVIGKPGSHFSLSIDSVREELIAKIRAIGAADHSATRPAPPTASKRPTLNALDPNETSIVLIGSSTGGPPTLEHILKTLKPTFPCPIVIVQHMPPMFTKSLAERLDAVCDIAVCEGRDRQELKPGTVYIAPGGFQAHIKQVDHSPLRLVLKDPAPTDTFKPDVNTLFRSAAESIGGRCAAFVLTGMGSDGAQGARVLHDKNAKIISQERSSCIVYGMPRAVEELGICDAVADIEGIARLLGTLGETRASSAA